MNLFFFLDIAIGLVVIYLVLSLLASEIQEIITVVLEWRAKHLQASIINLVSGKLTAQIYDNPLIKSLNQKALFRKKSAGPSYMPKEIFTAALLEILERDWRVVIDPSADIDTLVNSLEQSSLPEDLKQKLHALGRKVQYRVQKREEQFQEWRKELEEWFDSSMDRAGGGYKRNSKGVAIIIGFIVSILANADTFYAIEALATQPILRNTLNQFATEVVSKETTACVEAASDKESKAECVEPVKENTKALFADVPTLPIGWDLSNPWRKQFSPFTLKAVLKAIFGWSIGAIAISMGAPFWFGLLAKVIDIRNTGRKPNSGSSF